MSKDVDDRLVIKSVGDEDDSSILSDLVDDEDDYLDELDSNEDNGTPSPRNNGGCGGDPFVLKNALPAPRSVSYSTKWLCGVVSCFLLRDTN